MKFKTNEQNDKINDLQQKVDIQAEKTEQIVADEEELDFLKLNLLYSSKCQRSTFKTGYKVGTPEYRECILRRGKKSND